MASKKVKNILYSIGTIGAAITPVATVLSCGSSGDDGARVHDQTPADAAKAFIVDAHSFIGNGKVMQVRSSTTSGGQSDEGDSPEVSTANLVINADATDSTPAASTTNEQPDFTASLILAPGDNFNTVTREKIRKAFMIRDEHHNEIAIQDDDIELPSTFNTAGGPVTIAAGNDGKKKMETELVVTLKNIKDCIYNIRDVQVMIDHDLAEIYGVETKNLNRAVKRNIDRFPEKFRFQLTENEQDDVILEWLKRSIKKSDMIVEDFLSKK